MKNTKISKYITMIILACLLCTVALGSLADTEADFIEQAAIEEVIEEVVEEAIEEIIEEPTLQPEEEEEEATEEADEQLEESEQAASYTVSFVNWDGAELYAVTLEQGQTIDQPLFLSPIREGYLFDCWVMVTGEGLEEAYVFGAAASEDLVIWARYTELVVIAEDSGEDNEEITGETLPETDASAQGPVLPENENSGEEGNEDELIIIIIEDDELDAILGEEEEDTFLLEGNETPLASPARSVIIYSNAGSCVEENAAITLTAELTGFEGLEYALQWQINDGSGWSDIPGENGLSLAYNATQDSMNAERRLAVTIL